MGPEEEPVAVGECNKHFFSELCHEKIFYHEFVLH